jgi:hypothetical protein
MSEESDGIREAVEHTLRIAVSAAGMLAEQLARLRERQLHQAKERSEYEAQQLQLRWAGEREAARAAWAAVDQKQWWDHAGVEDVAEVLHSARAWAEADPEARTAVERIRHEVNVRYGVDIDAPGADPAAVAEYLARAQVLRAEAEEQRHLAAEEADAAVLSATESDQEKALVDVAAQAAEHEPHPTDRAEARVQVARHHARSHGADQDSRQVYDSAQRREAVAQDLQRRGVDAEVVASMHRADISQGKPATEATKGTRAKSPAARKSRRGPGVQAQRGGLDR